MVKILQNTSLKAFNTFGIEVNTRFLVTINSLDDVLEVRKNFPTEFDTSLVIGKGSNLLFTQDFSGLIIHIAHQGIEKINEDQDAVYVKAAAGEEWDGFVAYCVKNGWNGLENLSLIPGTVGASPVQNIGAYGVEIQDVFYSLKAINRKTGALEEFFHPNCEFAYRNSIFKQAKKEAYIIWEVVYKLPKKHSLKLEYGNVKEELNKRSIVHPTIQDVRDVICAIRLSKIPDPKEMGSAGSFFKNPEVSKEKAEALLQRFPNMVQYQLPNGNVKLAAGWLIEHAGWKGKRIGDAGVNEKQALVLVNYNNATGAEIKNLAEQIQQSVHEMFQVKLEPEVIII